MAETKQPDIPNKYDPYTVKAKLDESIEKLFESKFDHHPNTTVEYTMIVLGLLTGVAALLSYFHPAPWPADKPLIIAMVLLYYSVYTVLAYIKKTKFDMMGLSKEHKSAGVWLKITTVTEMFENCYNVSVSIWNSADNACIGEATIEGRYTQYVTESGYVCHDKLEELVYNVLKEIPKKTN